MSVRLLRIAQEKLDAAITSPLAFLDALRRIGGLTLIANGQWLDRHSIHPRL